MASFSPEAPYYPSRNVTNASDVHLPGGYDTELEVEDTNWILTSSFIIFTMQTGFGMLESGCVSIKNEVNIMMKNVVDIVLGGLTYWMFGYAMSFGKGPLTNPFIGIGGFFIDPSVGDEFMGPLFAAFLFQLSFATTATTIVSGAMAERCDFKAYCIFSFLNTAVYCIPAGWVWGEHGFLYNLGAVDIAGSGPVHLIGGSAAFASAAMLGPRLGRYANGRSPLPPGSPVNAVLGLFVLWWGWLAFNSGSTYGVSGAKWQYAARAAVVTMIGSFGGGVFGLIYSLCRFKGKLDLMDLINSVLGALVSITAGCFLYHSWEALLIGAIGGAIACLTMPLVDLMGVDDPVGASSVHGFCGIWGVVAVGLFADNPEPLDTTRGRSGLFKGGGWYLLGVQSLTAVLLAVWGLASTAFLLWIISLFRNIRMTAKEELLGADLTEHMIRHGQDDIASALQILRPYMDIEDLMDTIPIGSNPGHKIHMDEFYPPKSMANGPKCSGREYSGKRNSIDAGTVVNTIDYNTLYSHTNFPQSSKKIEFEDEIERYNSSKIHQNDLFDNQYTLKHNYNIAFRNNDRRFFANEIRSRNDIVEFNGEHYRVLKVPPKQSGKGFMKGRSIGKITKLDGSNLRRNGGRFCLPRPNSVASEERARMGWID